MACIWLQLELIGVAHSDIGACWGWYREMYGMYMVVIRIDRGCTQ